MYSRRRQWILPLKKISLHFPSLRMDIPIAIDCKNLGDAALETIGATGPVDGYIVLGHVRTLHGWLTVQSAPKCTSCGKEQYSKDYYCWASGDKKNEARRAMCYTCFTDLCARLLTKCADFQMNEDSKICETCTTCGICEGRGVRKFFLVVVDVIYFTFCRGCVDEMVDGDGDL